jgi:hypothetical protein
MTMTTTGPKATAAVPSPAPSRGGQVPRVVDVEGVSAEVGVVDIPTGGHH